MEALFFSRLHSNLTPLSLYNTTSIYSTVPAGTHKGNTQYIGSRRILGSEIRKQRPPTPPLLGKEEWEWMYSANIEQQSHDSS
jgi:hypothetical protein